MEIKGLVSVIIPVYQAEKYLVSCVEKIQMQTYSPLEIVLVNDGSQDKTAEICETLKTTYDNVQVCHQKNLGCGQARKTGLLAATGEYVVFVDVDDELFSKETIAQMKELLEKQNGDILVGNYCRRIHGEIILAARHGFDETTQVDTRDFRFCGFFSGGVMAYTWGKMYRNSFLRKHNITFEDLDYAEDKLFNICCYLNKPSYVFTDEDVYVYTQNPKSISYRYKPNYFDIWMKIAKLCETYIQTCGHKDSYWDFSAYIIFFAAFFQAKQEYEYHNKSMANVRKTLQQYQTDAMAGQYLKDMAKGRYNKGVKSYFWRMMMRGFSVAMSLRCYGVLALGIKILIDMNVDGRLSSTGKNKKK